MYGTSGDARKLEALRSSCRALALGWDLTAVERRMLLPCGGAEGGPPSAEAVARVRHMVELHHRLPFGTDPDGAREWLRTPIPAFGQMSPVDIIARRPGRVADLRRYAEWLFAS